MIIPLSVVTTTRLEKAALDNGFDRELPSEPGWLAYASTHAPLGIWLAALGEDLFLVAFSQSNVAKALTGQGIPLERTVALSDGSHRDVVDGANLVLEKPIELASLRQVLRALVTTSQTRPDSNAPK